MATGLERLRSLNEEQAAQLAAPLLDRLEGGASVGFLQALTLSQAQPYVYVWLQVTGPRCWPAPH